MSGEHQAEMSRIALLEIHRAEIFVAVTPRWKLRRDGTRWPFRSSRRKAAMLIRPAE
jgi:hypothetical protein